MDAEDTPTPGSDDHIELASRAEAFAELADLDAEAAAGGPDPFTAGDDDGGAEVEGAPPVVAVVVVHDAGDWLDELLASLGDQTYTNLSVLVIDAASDIDPTPRVARILPGAFVRRLESNVGFGPTVNEILDLVSGAAFYCVCHDDVALDPDAIHELVAEAFRSNAGIVGPKLVDWDDPTKLLSVGFTVDRSAGRAPYAEHHELDQGQHDAVRDVFAVAGGCTLVRADLFAHLGGFDPGIDLLGEDLDLCWRAHLVGARVVVAPRARARHRQALDERIDRGGLVRVDAVHRLRTVLANYRLGRLLVLLPQLLVISVIEAVVETAIGRPEHARAQLRAWGTNLRAAPSILRARRRVRAIREHDDRAITPLQTRTWPRLDGLIQAHRRARAEEKLADETATGEPEGGRDAQLGAEIDDAERDSFVRTGAPRRAYSLVSWGVVGVVTVLAIGTRELFFGPLPTIGSFAGPPGSVGDVWRTWLGSWNPSGIGSAQSPAAGLGPLAIAGSLTGGALGFLRRTAILLPVPIGLFGVWRLARPVGSRRAQLVALVVYAAVPVPWNALSGGKWGGLAVYAVAPWIVAVALRALRAAPFGRGDHPRARWWSPVLGYGLLLAVVGTVVPAVALVAVVVAVGLVLGSLAMGRIAGLGRLVGTTVGAVAVAAVLTAPWTLVGPGRSAWVLAGMGGSTHGWVGLDDILRFQSGPMGAGILGFAFLVAAALPLLIGRSWRFAWGVRAWAVALSCFAVVWVGQQDWFGVPVPVAEVFLAPAAVGLALAVACGAAAVEVDLPTFRFGGAQVVSVVATAALVVATFPTIGNAADGRWRMAPVGLDSALDFITTQRDSQTFRVLWMGDPAVMPVAGWHLDDHVEVGVTDHGMATMAELWAPADPGGSGALLDALELATDAETTRLGRVLADMDVRYVVLPRQTVPLPYRSGSHDPPAGLLAALDDQLDLARVSVNDAVVVYRNEAWDAGSRLYPADMRTGTSVGDALDAPDGQQVTGRVDATRTSRLNVPGPGILATGQPADPSWRLTVGGTAATPVTLWGWEQGFEVPRAGRATLTRADGLTRPLVLAGVGLAWMIVIVGWALSRRTRDDETLVDGPVTEPADGSGSLVRLGGPATTSQAVEVTEVRVGDTDATDADSAASPGEDAP